MTSPRPLDLRKACANERRMKVLVFGATGMVGQGVLRECLLAPDVEGVVSVVRRSTGKTDPKLRELVHADFQDFSGVAGELAGYDASSASGCRRPACRRRSTRASPTT